MKMKMKIINTIAVIVYCNPYNNRQFIYKMNKNKSGIYCWKNLITNKIYIGSAKSLSNRFSIYFSENSLKRKLKEGTSIISNALLKYKYYNFRLEILEYCNIECLISKEQYYIDLLKPQYNILKIAGSRLGIKLSKETKDLLRKASTGRKHTKEAKIKMIESAKFRMKLFFI